MTRDSYCVFIPAYNAEKTIRETLEGVRGSLQYAGMDIPVYVYDDRSKDKTSDIVKEMANGWPLLHYRCNNENVGERRTTNAALAELGKSATWMFIIHADDIPRNDWISVMVEAVERHGRSADLFVVWSSFDVFFDSGDPEKKGDDSGTSTLYTGDIESARKTVARITSNWHISGCCLHVERSLEAGGFDERMPQYGDTDFYARGLMKGYSVVYIRKCLTRYRQVATSVSSVSYRTSRDVREMFILEEKFRDILSPAERRSVLVSAGKTSFRRIIKSVFRADMPMFKLNAALLMRSLKNLLF